MEYSTYSKINNNLFSEKKNHQHEILGRCSVQKYIQPGKRINLKKRSLRSISDLKNYIRVISDIMKQKVKISLEGNLMDVNEEERNQKIYSYIEEYK